MCDTTGTLLDVRHDFRQGIQLTRGPMNLEPGGPYECQSSGIVPAVFDLAQAIHHPVDGILSSHDTEDTAHSGPTTWIRTPADTVYTGPMSTEPASSTVPGAKMVPCSSCSPPHRRRGGERSVARICLHHHLARIHLGVGMDVRSCSDDSDGGGSHLHPPSPSMSECERRGRCGHCLESWSRR